MQKAFLHKTGTTWSATLHGFRISVKQIGDQWQADVRGRHYLQDRATFTGPTIHDVAAQARKWIETATGRRRN